MECSGHASFLLLDNFQLCLSYLYLPFYFILFVKRKKEYWQDAFWSCFPFLLFFLGKREGNVTTFYFSATVYFLPFSEVWFVWILFWPWRRCGIFIFFFLFIFHHSGYSRPLLYFFFISHTPFIGIFIVFLYLTICFVFLLIFFSPYFLTFQVSLLVIFFLYYFILLSNTLNYSMVFFMVFFSFV